MKIPSIAVFFLSVIAWCLPAKADSGVLLCSGSISGSITYSGGVTMPPYALYDGCAPTSIAMVLAYWDLRYGYSKLFSAQGSDLYTETNVETGAKSINTIANDCGTVNEKTTITGATNGLVNYCSSVGYTFQASALRISNTNTWNTMVSEINAGRPVMFSVDESGTGAADHIVPVFGYEIISGTDYYACYTTDAGDTTPVWEKFVDVNYENGAPYTPYAVDEIITITSAQVPEPTTLFFVLSGAALLIIFQRRRLHRIHSQ